MDSAFSSAIRIADFNDYIAPSQDCVVSLNGKIKKDEASRTGLRVQMVEALMLMCVRCQGQLPTMSRSAANRDCGHTRVDGCRPWRTSCSCSRGPRGAVVHLQRQQLAA